MSTPASTLPFEIDARSAPILGMSPSDFLRDYWQKRPLLIRNAFPDFETPVLPEDLAGLACEETALSRIVMHDKATDGWTLRTGPFAEEEFPGMPHHDWTLLVQDVDKWDPDIRALLDHFTFLPRWRIDDVMISFAAPGGSVGAHIDQYDVFLLQAYGHRRWQIDASEAMGQGRPSSEFREGVELKLLREFHPTHDWVLGPGDMLYLPPGTAVPTRVHGAFVSDQEVHRVVAGLKKGPPPTYIDEIITGPKSPIPGFPSDDEEGGGEEADGEQDPLYDEAVRIVVETRKASISGVQRRLKIGYNRAARLVETMEAAGLVGPLQPNGSREILVAAPVQD